MLFYFTLCMLLRNWISQRWERGALHKSYVNFLQTLVSILQILTSAHHEDFPQGPLPRESGLSCLLCPWISESENESRSVVSDSLRPLGLYSPWNSPGHNTGVGYSLLQGIFPTQGSNPCLPHCRQILYQLSHKRSPRILEWVAFPFSRGSSQPRDQTHVSHIAGEFFTS